MTKEELIAYIDDAYNQINNMLEESKLDLKRAYPEFDSEAEAKLPIDEWVVAMDNHTKAWNEWQDFADKRSDRFSERCTQILKLRTDMWHALKETIDPIYDEVVNNMRL